MKIKKIGRFIVYEAEQPSKSRSWIDDIDLALDKLFWMQIYRIETNSYYSDWDKEFCKNLLEFLDNFEYITWAQYNVVMKMKEKSENYNPNYRRIKYDHVKRENPLQWNAKNQ